MRKCCVGPQQPHPGSALNSTRFIVEFIGHFVLSFPGDERIRAKRLAEQKTQ